MDEVNLQKVIVKLRQWSKEKGQIKRLWIYGSRITKTHKPDSDLDIAFEIFPLLNETEKKHFQEKILPLWKQEIQEFTSWEIHLEPWAGDGTNVAHFVLESGQLIYQSSA
jgi:predicted nucleotidyltransferase